MLMRSHLTNIPDTVLQSTTPLELLLMAVNDREARLFLKTTHAITYARHKRNQIGQELATLKNQLES